MVKASATGGMIHNNSIESPASILQKLVDRGNGRAENEAVRVDGPDNPPPKL